LVILYFCVRILRLPTWHEHEENRVATLKIAAEMQRYAQSGNSRFLNRTGRTYRPGDVVEVVGAETFVLRHEHHIALRLANGEYLLMEQIPDAVHVAVRWSHLVTTGKRPSEVAAVVSELAHILERHVGPVDFFEMGDFAHLGIQAH
jgi:hypothetical protein